LRGDGGKGHRGGKKNENGWERSEGTSHLKGIDWEVLKWESVREKKRNQDGKNEKDATK